MAMPRRRRRCTPRHVLVFATAPLWIGSANASATVIVRSIKPGNVTPLALSRPASMSTSGATTAYPTVTPINGFQPFITVGLTNENDKNDFFSPKAATPLANESGASFVPNPANFFVATLDTGASSHILSYETGEMVNLFAGGVEGANSIEVGGVSGTEELQVSDALGVYVSGLQNATAGANGPVVPTNTLKGMWNTSILSTFDENSLIPNLIGNPITAHWQIGIKNSQTQRITVNGTTYQGPSVTMSNIGTAHDSTYVEMQLTPQSPGGANSTPAFEPDFFGSFDNLADDPLVPTFWNALMTNTRVTRGAGITTQPFLFDTGAQVTVISTATATAMGIDTGGSNPTPVDFTAEVLGVGGITVVNGYYIDSLHIDTTGIDLDVNNVPVLVLDVDDPSDGTDAVPGILGMNLFRDRDLIINAKTGTGSYLAMTEFPVEAKWKVNANGNWGDNPNWQRGVPWQPGEEANFTSAATAPRTINVEADYTLGHMSFNNANRYTISGTGKLTFMENVGRASVQVNTGSHTVSTNVELASDTEAIVIPAASTLTMSGVINSANGSGLIKTGQGTLEVKRMQGLGALDVQAGKARVLPPAVGASAFNRTSSVDTVAVGAAAKLDLTNNNLVVHNVPAGTWNGTDYTGVQGLVRKGNHDGAWDGAGGILTSTADAASGLTSLGVARAGDVVDIDVNGNGVWAGHDVTADSTLVMYTYAGDANLDGLVSGDDYSAIDFSVLVPGSSGWSNGDFNWDGHVTGDDYSAIDFSIIAQGAPFPTASGVASVAAVPEPAALGVTLIAAAPLLGRSRRRRIE
jgi:hypothetical protein